MEILVNMVSVKNQQGKPVDWWFIYKTPDHTGTDNNKGFDFLYFDPDFGALNLSPVGLDQHNQALSHTLTGIFNAPDSAGYLVYNDEHVDKEENSSTKGHCKGDREKDCMMVLLQWHPF